jgi:hypothetical protein
MGGAAKAILIAEPPRLFLFKDRFKNVSGFYYVSGHAIGLSFHFSPKYGPSAKWLYIWNGWAAPK